MTETGQVKSAVVERLEAAGLTAMSAFEEERMRRHASSAVVVGVRQMRIEQMGLIDYLGEICEADGSHTEVYGREMKLQLSVDVYTPRELGASESERTAEAAAQALMAALPGGLQIEELSWGETAWDKKCGMFLLPGTARCAAQFTARAEEDSAVLKDFILRGVIRA